jgi:hypothetical protein
LEEFLGKRKVRDLADGPSPDDNVRFSADDRPDEQRDVSSTVLVVGVGVHDNVRALFQASFDARGKTARQPLMARQADNVMSTALPCHLCGSIRAAVIDDEPFDGVHAIQLPRQLSKRLRQRQCLVVTGDLDDELHKLLLKADF